VVDTPSTPPAPGDPRSTGPRPPARAKDVAWLGLAVALVTITVVQLGLLAWRAATDPAVAPTTGTLLLAFVVTVVWLLTVYWLAVGSWRRTVWGCPFDHTEAAPATRRCPRHGLLEDGDPAARPRDEAPPADGS
jgi:hypothetical protein